MVGVGLSALLAAPTWALGPAELPVAPSIRADAHTILAQFGILTVVPINPEQAFVEGYQAYLARDLMKTIERMTLAAEKYPALADYALFYLGSAQRDSGNEQSAAATFRRLSLSYPQSVFADQASLQYAEIEFKLGRLGDAQAAAAALAARNPAADIDSPAMLIGARSALGLGDAGGAFRQLQALREKYPQGAEDAEARTLAYSIAAAHPDAIDTHSLDYHRREAALLLHEGQSSMALAQCDEALALGPPPSVRAETLWLRARASRVNSEREMLALNAYLKYASHGDKAPEALYRLGHLQWRTGDTQTARATFTRLIEAFPASPLAPAAMFDIGRAFEDDANWNAARAEYLRLVRSYPHSDEAADGRFRAPFALYMTGQFDAAAREFASMKPLAASASERDGLSYWHARSLERSGQAAAADTIYQGLAQSTASNYYPELAARRIGAPVIQGTAPDTLAADTAVPSAVPGTLAAFHLDRVAALKRLGTTYPEMIYLEPAELRALATQDASDPRMRDFVLAELQRTGDWYAAIEVAVRLEKNGSLDSSATERVRYPRAYWDTIAQAAGGDALDPYLVLALVRQESLFNPQARSVSDARGLMQLMPATADRVGPAAGVQQASLNLYDPSLSVRVGTTYLKSLFVMFGGDPFKAVAAYNAGEHAVQNWNAKYPGDDDQWVENIGFRETRDYVKRVIGGLREYRMLYPSATVTSGGAPHTQGPS
ncbi:MAG TPA: transglycosylase SLT domain-containing protein [Candidatus Binataceae bacterium]